MKKKMLIIAILALCITSEAIAAQPTGFTLAWFSPTASQSRRQAVFEKQIKPISEAFGLTVGSKLEENAYAATLSDQFNAVDAIEPMLNIDIPTGDMKSIDYSVVREGKELNEITDTLQVGDIIRFKPKIESIGQDWITQGASVDSPPVILLEPEVYSALVDVKLRQKFITTYPCNEFLSCTDPIPAFTAQTSEFNETGNSYIADDGYPAYIIPLTGGKKAGLQVFCALTLTSSYANCEVVQNWFECKIKDTSAKNPRGIGFLSYAVFIDKIIDGKKATQANWFQYLGQSIQNGYTVLAPWRGMKIPSFQIILKGKKAPVADFECKVGENRQGQKITVIECNATASHDPDGTIQKYEWDNGTGEGNEYKKPIWENQKQYTVALKVTDDDGFYDTKTKTFTMEQQPITEFTAEYNKQTKMVEIWAKCNTQNIKVDIDQLDNQANPTNSIIEKTTIPCNQTTPIGPIKTKGNYQATTTINGKTKTAIFTIN